MAPHPTSPPQARPHGPSFQQLLLLAFLLIAGLLGASALRAVFTLETLMGQSQASAAQAAALNVAAQALNQRGQAMERSARQSLVLNDPLLRQSFDDLAADAQGIVRQLSDAGLPPAQAQQWQARMQAVHDLLRAPPWQSLESERSVAEEFVALDTLHAAITQSVQELNARQASELQARVDASRRTVMHQLVGAIVLALVLALWLGIGLARPFKRLERAIRRLGENQLEQPVAITGPADVRRVGQQLEWLRLRLLELDADKARFLRHVSHELKTPLAALREGVALLQDGVTGELSEGQKEVTQILHQNTLVLQSEIEALLRFNAAAFEARQLQRRETDLIALLEDLVEAQRLQWQARSLRVEVSGERTVLLLDAEKITSAMGNLLSNAIRFSPEQGTVRLAVSRVPGQVQVDVTDDGPGVAPADRAHVFEPFYRGERQPENAVRGTGIGLSIVQEYIHAHGGRVQVLQMPGDAPRSFFRIELPDVS
ncbi:MAG: HAMP domain-containing sensor histidine kinase [Acidovorax sp.]|nr:HAMP domain-containing sensor histidine kinase [Acidovorax sp.]